VRAKPTGQIVCVYFSWLDRYCTIPQAVKHRTSSCHPSLPTTLSITQCHWECELDRLLIAELSSCYRDLANTRKTGTQTVCDNNHMWIYN